MHSGSFIRAPDSLDRMRCWREADSGAFPQPGRGPEDIIRPSPLLQVLSRKGVSAAPGLLEGDTMGRGPQSWAQDRGGAGAPRGGCLVWMSPERRLGPA